MPLIEKCLNAFLVQNFFSICLFPEVRGGGNKNCFHIDDYVGCRAFGVLLQMVFGNCGVLLEMSPAKGYVEMTGIDAETSQDIAEVCNSYF
jgi:hypothetical protein